MANHRVIKVKFIAETNSNSAKCSLFESRFNKTDRKSIYFNWSDYTSENAIGYLKSIGLNIIGWGVHGSDYFIFSDSWADGNGFINIKGGLEL